MLKRCYIRYIRVIYVTITYELVIFWRNFNVGHLRYLIVVVPSELFVFVPSDLFGHS